MKTVLCAPHVQPNGLALSCGADKFLNTQNETSSFSQLSIKYKTYARHEFRTQLIPSA
jgi:hypothetical protein